MKMINALNFKPFTRGSIKGFFDLRYHGLTIKGCRLMDGNGGLWVAFPQRQGEKDGETKWFDQMYLTAPEMEHVRRVVIADLSAHGHIEAPAKNSQRKSRQYSQQRESHQTPEGEDLSQHYSTGDDDGDIPF
jgi:DNA-binding cell septation regulator SpoVG